MKIRSQIYKNYQYVAVADIHTCNNRQLRPFSINNNASDTVSAVELAKCLSRTVRRHRRSCMILRTLFHCPCKTSVALAGLWHASVCIDCYKSPGIRWTSNGGMPCNQDRNQQLQPVFCRTVQLFHRPSYARKQYRSMRHPSLLLLQSAFAVRAPCRDTGRPVGAAAEGDSSALVPAYPEILRRAPAPQTSVAMSVPERSAEGIVAIFCWRQ